MIRRLKRMAKLNRRIRRYRGPWKCSLNPRGSIGFLSREFVEWATWLDKAGTDGPDTIP